MKSSRILSLLGAAFAVPALFAATASVGTITGKAVIASGETETPLAAGQIIAEGTMVETGSSSSTTINLSNGGKLVIGANARVRLTFNGDQLRIELLRGTVGGSFPTGTTIATAGGTASVGGLTGAVQFTNGTLIVAPVSGGTASVKPISPNEPAITVPSGNSVAISPAGATTPSALTPEAVEAINNGLPATLTQQGGTSGQPGNKPATTAPKAELPDLSKIVPISPVSNR